MASTDETLDDMVLGPALHNRACGDCVACCQFPLIDAPELKKPEGVLCPNCSGAGCQIYDARPVMCRQYFCVWRRIGALPETARPNQINVLLHLMRPPNPQNLLARLYIKAQAFKSWADFENPQFLEALAVLKRARLPVWLQYGDVMRLAHPSQEVADVILNGAAPSSPRLAAEARAWVEIHSKS